MYISHISHITIVGGFTTVLGVPLLEIAIGGPRPDLVLALTRLAHLVWLCLAVFAVYSDVIFGPFVGFYDFPWSRIAILTTRLYSYNYIVQTVH